MNRWYKIRNFELFLDEETAQLLMTVLKGYIQDLPETSFNPKQTSITYAQALDWVGSQRHGEVNLDGLFKYV